MIPGGSGGVKRPLLSKVPVAAAETGGDIAGKVFRTFVTVFFLAVLGGTLFFAISTFLDNRTQDTRLDANQVAIESEVVIRAAAVDALTATDAILQADVADRISTLNWVHGDNNTHNVDLTVNGTGLTIVGNHTLHQVILTNEAILDINGVFPTEGSGSLLLDGTGMIDIISPGNISTITVDGSMIVTQLSNLQAQVSMQQIEILELQTNQTQVQTVVDALIAALNAISGGMNGTQDLNMTITQLVVNVTTATLNIAQLQAQVANLTMNEPMPGMLIPWAAADGSTPPAGWLICNGNEYNIVDYPALHAIIGTMYCPGPCSSISVFAVPDLRGRTIAHKGGSVLNVAVGTKLGAETHTLTSGEMPSHQHTGNVDPVGDHQHAIRGTINNPGSGGFPDGTDLEGFYTDLTLPAGGHGHSFTTNAAGSGGAHNNIQPTIVMQYLIKT